MKSYTRLVFMAVLALFLASGCSNPILKQDIPVSTNPMGAKVYANGQPAGVTPTTVSLERNRSHILTLVKESYRQEDVTIERMYQKDKVYLKAIQSGIHSGLFFKNPAMGVGSSMNSFSAQEESGEAYILSPPAVKVTLTPLGGVVRGDSAPPPAASREASSPDRPAGEAQAPHLDRKDFAREVLKMGAGAALTQVKPIEKRVETSSSSRNYVTPDGTRVQEKSSTSVGVGINPAGLVGVLDVLFK
ncbi:MAG: PEGA domain-containing protein [Deltaproteobacteria bacterium]|nr:PEGA domain-containing protein [Deltaproteobacteria bacterium]